MADILASLIAAVASVLASYLYGRVFHRKKAAPKSYSQRLAELTDSLTKASADVDAVLKELSEVARQRETAVRQLESDLASMEGREQELKARIEMLQSTPIPVAQHFARLLEGREGRSARRDYALFGAGVLITTVIAIAIQVFAR